MRTCSLETCDRKYRANGYCDGHYKRYWKYGDPFENVPLGSRRRLIPSEKPTHYTTVHKQIKALWGLASDYPCVQCGKRARDWAYDGTDPTECLTTGKVCRVFYSIWPEFYMPLCRKCHKTRDGKTAAAELVEYREWRYATGLTLADVTPRN